MTDEQKNILLGSIIGFSLSVLSQLINRVFNFFYKKHKVASFRKLVFNTYIKDVRDGLMVYEDKNKEELIKKISESIKKIDYFLKNELSYLNADWQFEAIRICEFAKTKLKQVSDQLKEYSFENTEDIEIVIDIKINKEKSLIIIADYEKRVKAYHRLKSERTI